MEMKTIYGFKVEVIGSTLLTHKKTGKQKYFIVFKSRLDNVITTCTTSDISGMTQKKAESLPRISPQDVIIDMCTCNNGYK